MARRRRPAATLYCHALMMNVKSYTNTMDVRMDGTCKHRNSNINSMVSGDVSLTHRYRLSLSRTARTVTVVARAHV